MSGAYTVPTVPGVNTAEVEEYIRYLLSHISSEERHKLSGITEPEYINYRVFDYVTYALQDVSRRKDIDGEIYRRLVYAAKILSPVADKILRGENPAPAVPDEGYATTIFRGERVKVHVMIEDWMKGIVRAAAEARRAAERGEPVYILDPTVPAFPGHMSVEYFDLYVIHAGGKAFTLPTGSFYGALRALERGFPNVTRITPVYTNIDSDVFTEKLNRNILGKTPFRAFWFGFKYCDDFGCSADYRPVYVFRRSGGGWRPVKAWVVGEITGSYHEAPYTYTRAEGNLVIEDNGEEIKYPMVLAIDCTERGCGVLVKKK